MNRAMLKQLFNYLKARDDISDDLKEISYTYNLPKHTGAKKQIEMAVLDYEQVKSLADNMPNKQTCLMCLLSYFCGLRISELLTLGVNDIIWERKVMKIRWSVSKRKKERFIIIPDWFIDELVYFIDEKVKESQSYAQAKTIFPYSYQGWERLIRKTAIRIGLPGKITPHTLRHSIATHLLAGGLSLIKLKSFLGHSSIISTKKYVHILDQEGMNQEVLDIIKEQEEPTETNQEEIKDGGR